MIVLDWNSLQNNSQSDGASIGLLKLNRPITIAIVITKDLQNALLCYCMQVKEIYDKEGSNKSVPQMGQHLNTKVALRMSVGLHGVAEL